MEAFSQLGIGGIFAILVIREVMTFLKTKNETKAPESGVLSICKDTLEKILRMQKDLHEWHKPDQNGEQSWKGHRLAEAIERNTTVMEKLVPILDRIDRADNPRIQT